MAVKNNAEIMTQNEILELIKGSEGKKIKVAVSDIDGILRGKVVHKDKFFEIVEKGLGFCDVVFGWDSGDVCYDNSKFTGWHSGYPDAEVRIDLSTYRTIPWENNLPMFLGDYSSLNNEGAVVCPRNLLKKIQNQCANLGFYPLFALEFEWFNFAGTPQQLAESNYTNLKPLTPGMFGYSILRPSLNSEYFNALFDYLEKFDIQLEGLHTETGPGVYEAAIRHDEILRSADKAILFKTAVKEIAYKYGIMASFMAKWNKDLPGCGGHIHQSLWDKSGGKNLFFDGKNSTHMSELMKSYLAGQLACLPYILPMYAPTVNSYKRLVEGTWAPVSVNWGIDNRTTAVRVLNKDSSATRIETRVPGADLNPYLGMAAALASGLYGIKNNLQLELQETQGNGYKGQLNNPLSADLNDAIQVMKGSSIAKELFGEGFTDHFIRTREWEWKQFSKQVTSWELKRYFEII
jgi:glutamine synthetase